MEEILVNTIYILSIIMNAALILVILAIAYAMYKIARNLK